MKSKFILLASILGLAVGFATVSTVLYINGTLGISGNYESFIEGVIFTKAKSDDGGSASISQDGHSINYISKTLVTLNAETYLQYTISNLSKDYDVEATISCITTDSTNTYNDYISLTLDKSSYRITSGGSVDGSLTVKLVKNVEVEKNIEIECSINAKALERTSNGTVIVNSDNTLTGIITDSEENPLTSGYLAIYSDTLKVVEIGSDGSIKVECLEDGTHEVYYMGETDPTNMKKSDVKAKAITYGNFTTTMNSNKITLTKESAKNYIINAVIGQQVNLYNMMKTNAKNDIVDFSQRSGDAETPTNGIYTTKETESGKEVYYYRGNVNNNLIFNNMCWKIVRTTETGGVKLIYNGLPSSGTCNNTGDASQLSSTSAFNTNYNDNAYVGYMYGTAGSDNYDATHANINNSTIKTAIDTWYSTNFTSESVKNKIEDTVYCNDRSIVEGGNNNTFSSSDFEIKGYGTNGTGYGALARASYYTILPSPSLVCTNKNDKFTVNTSNGNGSLTYPVGLITLDETVFAGFNTNASNTGDYQDTNNYLYTGSNYWTLSPLYMTSWGTAFAGYVYNSGVIVYTGVPASLGVRPLISLKPGTTANFGGTGTTLNPYVVE